MANGMGLERLLLYRRKGSATASETSVTTTAISKPDPGNCTPVGAALHQLSFPSPTFIRPKTSRMAAREEVRMKQPSSRSTSPSVGSAFRAQPALPNRKSTSTSHSSRSKSPPKQYSPLHIPEYDDIFSALHDFQFPKPPAHDMRTSLGESMRSNQEQSRSPCHSPPPSMSVVPPRLDTPPSSDPEDNSRSWRALKNKRLPDLPYQAPPTPRESPKAGPMPDDDPICCKSVDILDKSFFKDIPDGLGRPIHRSPSHGRQSSASLLPSALPLSHEAALREPDFDEFFSLTDDDIAETILGQATPPPTPEIPRYLQPMPLSLASSRSRTSALLALEPPYASGAATAAAFEAARIASRYDFDLIYVVNLWPGNPAEPATYCPMSKFGVSPAQSTSPMFGRLLAAYGLHHVPSPLQISSFVHAKVLRANGWIEYRNYDARPCDLARGYACAFYPGQYCEHDVPGSRRHVSGVKLSDTIDRGIVFAAYRKPRPGPNKLGSALDKENLGNLYRDAEALVEMLMDIHVASQLRQPFLQHQSYDHTGPMPLQTIQDV